MQLDALSPIYIVLHLVVTCQDFAYELRDSDRDFQVFRSAFVDLSHAIPADYEYLVN